VLDTNTHFSQILQRRKRRWEEFIFFQKSIGLRTEIKEARKPENFQEIGACKVPSFGL
jgi:hypothetical protein